MPTGTRTRFLLAVMLAAPAVPSLAAAQSVEEVIATKGRMVRQTDAVPPGASDDADEWYAEFIVRGSDLESIDPPKVVGPFGLGEPGHNNGFLGWNPISEEWNYGSPSFDGWAVLTRSELDSLFGAGTYTFLSDNSPVVDVSIEGDEYPGQWPGLDLSGGLWIDGRFLVDPRSAMLTIAIETPWSTYGEGLLDAVTIEVKGTEFRVVNLSVDGDPAAATLEIPRAGLEPGTSFEARAILFRAVDLVVGIPGFPDALAGGGFESAVDVLGTVGKLEDFDLDGEVGAVDLGTLLAAWGPCRKGCIADVDGDGVVGPSDLGAVLAAWGTYL